MSDQSRNVEKTTPPDLTVLLVSYNTRELTRRALASLEASTSVPHDVIVVDNASEDGSATVIRQEFPQVRLLALPENIGFGRANNLAAGLAEGKYLLLLNSDTEVLPGAVDALLAFARRRPGAGIWGGRTLFADGTLNPTSCWGRMTLWSVFCRAAGLSTVRPNSPILNPEAYPGYARDHERRVDIVTGCFFLIRRDLWESLGGFDPAFFMYGEEADLCLRARALGADPAVTPEATIIHLGGASQADRAMADIQLLAARIRLVRRHFPPWQRAVAVGVIRAGVLLRRLVGRWTGRVIQGRRRGDRDQRVWRARGLWWGGY